MDRRLIVLCLTVMVLALYAAPVVKAASESTWFWAESSDNREIIAFNLSGESRSIMRARSEILVDRVIRLDAQTALALLFRDNSFQLELYLWTPERAQPISLPFEKRRLRFYSHDDRYRFMRFAGSSAERINATRYLLQIGGMLDVRLVIDVSSATAAPLFASDFQVEADDPYADDLAGKIRAYDFSEDGRELRYVLRDAAADTLSLRAKALDSGEERIIANVAGNQYLVYSADHGSRWLFARPDFSTGLLVDLQGEVTEVALSASVNLCEFDVYEGGIDGYYSSDCNQIWQQGTATFVGVAVCNAICDLTMYPDSTIMDVLTGKPKQPGLVFDLPESEYDGNSMQVDEYLLFRIGDDRALFTPLVGSYWMLEQGGPPRLLGQIMNMSDVGIQTISSDIRWLLASFGEVQGKMTYGVVDLLSEEHVLDGVAPDYSVFGLFGSNGIFLLDSPITIDHYFRYRDRRLFDLPNPDDVADAPDSDDLLLNSERGVERYTPDTQRISLLVPDARLIRLDRLVSFETGNQ